MYSGYFKLSVEMILNLHPAQLVCRLFMLVETPLMLSAQLVVRCLNVVICLQHKCVKLMKMFF